jgi:tripartite-type tricarboxylate transporter receptor subunit TctC
VAGLNVQHVPYGGPVEALNDLAAGRIDFYFVPIVPALPLGAQGKAVPLAVSTTIRWPPLPDLPTLAEMGYPISTFLTWCGLSAPAKTPPAIIDKLNDAIGDVLDLPAIKFKFERIGFKPEQMDPEEYGKFLADDTATTIALGKEAHIQPLD